MTTGDGEALPGWWYFGLGVIVGASLALGAVGWF